MNDYDHVETLPSFYWTCSQKYDFMTSKKCFKYNHPTKPIRRWLEAGDFGFKKRDCTIRVAKTKTLISSAVIAKLICVFVFAYAKTVGFLMR